MKRTIVKFSKQLGGLYYNIPLDHIIKKFIEDFEDEGQKKINRPSNNCLEIINSNKLYDQYVKGLRLNYFFGFPYCKLTVIDNKENKENIVVYEIEVTILLKIGLFVFLASFAFGLLSPLFYGQMPNLQIGLIFSGIFFVFYSAVAFLEIMKQRTLLTENLNELKQEYDEKRTITQK